MGRRILVVDDERSAREALASILADEGYEVAKAADGQEALDLLPGFRPHAVLSDLRMPLLDGLGLLRGARAQGVEAPFVVMTAHADDAHVEEARKLGAHRVMIMPLNVDLILAHLKEAIELFIRGPQIDPESA